MTTSSSMLCTLGRRLCPCLSEPLFHAPLGVGATRCQRCGASGRGEPSFLVFTSGTVCPLRLGSRGSGIELPLPLLHGGPFGGSPRAIWGPPRMVAAAPTAQCSWHAPTEEVRPSAVAALPPVRTARAWPGHPVLDDRAMAARLRLVPGKRNALLGVALSTGADTRRLRSLLVASAARHVGTTTGTRRRAPLARYHLPLRARSDGSPSDWCRGHRAGSGRGSPERSTSCSHAMS